MTTLRRPFALWVIVGLYSSLILANYAFMVYMRFWSNHRSRFEAMYADWTLLDYATRYYPGVLILIGCAGLVMLRRWAVYVFALLLILRLRESALRFFADQHPDAPPILLWLPHVMMIVPPLLVFLYALHLARKGTLRKGI